MSKQWRSVAALVAALVGLVAAILWAAGVFSEDAKKPAPPMPAGIDSDSAVMPLDPAELPEGWRRRHAK